MTKNNILNKNYAIILFILSTFLFTGCETTNLDLQENPNKLTLVSADPNFILNNIQLNFGVQHNGLSELVLPIMRYTNMSGSYADNTKATTINDVWTITYAIMSDNDLIQDISLEQNLPVHVGMGQVLEAFALVNLVDFIGDAAYSEALDPAKFPNPKFDDGASIYAAMYTLLDEAILNLNKQGSITPNDIYYNGDVSKWIKLANTLKIKMYVSTKLVPNPNAAAEITKIINSGNYIKNSEDDFNIYYGTNTNPDVRNEFYTNNYLTRANTRLSNEMMDMMLHGNSIKDPRMNYYFYRQVLFDPNDPLIADFSNPFQPFPFVPCNQLALFGSQLCYIGEGYWGNDHGDVAGISRADRGRTLTTFGAYPIGGAFDASTTQLATKNAAIASYVAPVPPATGPTLDQWVLDKLADANPAAVDAPTKSGAGIQPVLTSSFSNFLIAEATLPAPQGLGVGLNTEAFLKNGLTESFNTVANFVGIPMNAADVTTYTNEVVTVFNTAATNDLKLSVIIKEFYIAAYLNGVEAYNMYRRTGYPIPVPDVPSILLLPGELFPRSFLYPSNELDTNDNPDVIQKESNAVQVFWDTNPFDFIK